MEAEILVRVGPDGRIYLWHDCGRTVVVAFATADGGKNIAVPSKVETQLNGLERDPAGPNDRAADDGDGVDRVG